MQLFDSTLALLYRMNGRIHVDFKLEQLICCGFAFRNYGRFCKNFNHFLKFLRITDFCINRNLRNIKQLLILRLCYVGEPFLSAPLYNKYYKKVKKNLKTFICCTFKVLQYAEIMFLVI